MIKIYKDNSKIGGHNDLILELSPLNFTQKADTYYFALDKGFRENDESTRKMIDNLINLLKNWIVQVNSLEDSQTIFLPFDFSDQYIGSLEVKLSSSDQLIVNYSTAIFNLGLPYSPSNYPKDFDLKKADSIHTEKVFLKLGRKEFIDGIKDSIKNLEKPENYVEWLN